MCMYILGLCYFHRLSSHVEMIQVRYSSPHVTETRRSVSAITLMDTTSTDTVYTTPGVYIHVNNVHIYTWYIHVYTIDIID